MNERNNAMTRLRASCAENGPLCVGLDTDPSYLPPELLRLYDSPAEAVLAYNKALIAECKSHAGCFKVQIAYYEAMGLAGLKAYAETLKILRTENIPFIADIKRGDIADTAKAYARAHFEGEFEADIVTLNPYMGFDTLEPFIEYIDKAGKGAFVLLRTSNPGMKDIENLELAGSGIKTSLDAFTASGNGSSVRVLDAVGAGLKRISARFAAAEDALGSDGFAADGYCSPIGAVVGCTEEADARVLRDRYPELFFLIPGYGAQGGAARIAATLLDRAGGTVNSSRAILTAWKKDQTLEIKMKSGSLCLEDIVRSASQAAFAAKADLLGAKKLLAQNVQG